MDLLLVKVMRPEMVMTYPAEDRQWVRGAAKRGARLGRQGRVRVTGDVRTPVRQHTLL